MYANSGSGGRGKFLGELPHTRTFSGVGKNDLENSLQEVALNERPNFENGTETPIDYKKERDRSDYK